MSKDASIAYCMTCGESLYIYSPDEFNNAIDLTYCDNKKCLRYKLVTLQEDV